VVEEEIQIPTADGTCDAVLYRQEHEQQPPRDIHLTDIGGIRPAHRDMARRLAGKATPSSCPIFSTAPQSHR
jgi:dienelactone hydrolase